MLTKVEDENGAKKETVDEYTKTIGEMGKWQIFVFLMTAVPMKIAAPSTWFGIIFLAPKTTYRCLERENSTAEVVNMTCYRDCKNYEYFSEFEGNVIIQWNLICDRAWIADFLQTIIMVGVLAGGNIFGNLSDRYGRRIALILASILETCTSFLAPFCPNLWSLIIVRFIIGTASAGTNMVSFVLLMEIFGQKQRDFLGATIGMPSILGHVLVSIIGYYYRTWRVFSVAMAIPTLTYLTYFFCIPESPKWLISVGKLDQACAVMTSAAKWNKLPTDNMMSIVENIAKESKPKNENQKKPTLMEVLTSPSLRLINLCNCLVWFAAGSSYYGGMQYFGQTSPNVFWMFALAGIIQVPGLILGGYISNRFGRRVAVITVFALSAIGNGVLALPNDWYYTKLAAGTIGISCAGAVIALIYVYTTELYPTVTRSTGMGLGSTANRIASMVIPFVGGLQKQASWIPPAVFAVIPIFGIISCFFLPETRNKKLEDHLPGIPMVEDSNSPSHVGSR